MTGSFLATSLMANEKIAQEHPNIICFYLLMIYENWLTTTIKQIIKILIWIKNMNT